MAGSPAAYDRGTRFTNYSSIHSADAFVGDYQVMYTPGNSPPQPARSNRKSTRFSRPPASVRNQTVSQSFVLPPNIPNTSQIVPENIGVLPNVQVRYTIPADEKQIVASLRTLQGDLNDAMSTIKALTRERDDAVHELRFLKATSRKTSTPKKAQPNHVEEELFDLTKGDDDFPKKPFAAPSSAKKVSISRGRRSPTPSQNARNLGSIAGVMNKAGEESHFGSRYRMPMVEEAEHSVLGDHTAASNTSRRRRHQLDENMTSAYILPDITVAQPVNPKPSLSKEVQQIVHGHDAQHAASCDMCQRLVIKPKMSDHITAQITALVNATSLDDPTMRPKIAPVQALANVKRQLTSQFEHAKQKHNEVWQAYDSIPAPRTSKKHDLISKELLYWQRKMEEFRQLLDNLRDVEEGMAGDEA